MIKKSLKSILSKLDYQVTKLEKNPLNSEQPFIGIRSMMTKSEQQGVFFDVGANIGQTIEELKSIFPLAKIYSFEPGRAFQELHKNFSNCNNVVLENIALGSNDETKVFYENNRWDMSSFLPLGEKGWGEIVKESTVTVSTLDTYCRQKGIAKINLLKCDTQGFELEVLKGAEASLENIQFVFLEISFTEIYKGLPAFFDIFNLLSLRGFKIVKFYRQQFDKNQLRHTDVLFHNPNFAG